MRRTVAATSGCVPLSVVSPSLADSEGGGSVDAGWWGFLGVVVGGVLTIGGQATAELIKARVVTRQQQERRAQLAREHQRATLVGLSDAMKVYRQALERDKAQLLPTRRSETALARARIEYQALVYRVSDAPAREAVQAWERQALLWFQDDDEGTAALEATTWTAAVEAVGLAVRATE